MELMMGLIQPLKIIAQHIVDKELVQAFPAKENDNDFLLIYFNLRARSILHGTDNIVLSQIASLVTRSSSKQLDAN